MLLAVGAVQGRLISRFIWPCKLLFPSDVQADELWSSEASCTPTPKINPADEEHTDPPSFTRQAHHEESIALQYWELELSYI
jgi:hypothetical protein